MRGTFREIFTGGQNKPKIAWRILFLRILVNSAVCQLTNLFDSLMISDVFLDDLIVLYKVKSINITLTTIISVKTDVTFNI